jgi:hypothetical protein
MRPKKKFELSKQSPMTQAPWEDGVYQLTLYTGYVYFSRWYRGKWCLCQTTSESAAIQTYGSSNYLNIAKFWQGLSQPWQPDFPSTSRIARAKEKGEKTRSYRTPCCARELEVLVPRNTEIWDSAVQCPHCGEHYHHVTTRYKILVRLPRTDLWHCLDFT